MDIQYYGANCVRLTTKKASIVIDDTLNKLGLKPITQNSDISLFTSAVGGTQSGRLVVDLPGEYEVSDVSIQGIPARSHVAEEGVEDATIFKVIADDVRIVILGHIFPKLSDAQLEKIGTVDIVIVPVGGNGYTLDGVDALKLIKAIEPRIIIPTHYADPAVNYEVPQLELAEATQGLAMEPKEALSKLRIKANDLPQEAQLMVLERAQ